MAGGQKERTVPYYVVTLYCNKCSGLTKIEEDEEYSLVCKYVNINVMCVFTCIMHIFCNAPGPEAYYAIKDSFV